METKRGLRNIWIWKRLILLILGLVIRYQGISFQSMLLLWEENAMHQSALYFLSLVLNAYAILAIIVLSNFVGIP